MKSKLSLARWAVFAMVGLMLGSSISCMNTYDAQGRPMQTVDPGVAVAGAAAAGVLGYAIANNRGDNHHHYNRGGYYPRRGGYYGGHRGGYYRRGGYR